MSSIGISPQNKEEYNLLYLNILMDLQYFPEALENVEKLLKAGVSNLSYREFLANYYYVQREFGKAQELYEQLIKTTGSKKYMVHVGWLKFLRKKKLDGTQDLVFATKQGDKNVRALAFYRLGLVYSLDKKLELESSQHYTLGYELIPKLGQAILDHDIYNELTKNKHRKILDKNVDIYLR